jgi:hypothetical protein
VAGDQVQDMVGKDHGGQILLLNWLEGQDGDSWQQRWLASGAEQAGTSWRQLPARAGATMLLTFQWSDIRCDFAPARRLFRAGAPGVAS